MELREIPIPISKHQNDTKKLYMLRRKAETGDLLAQMELATVLATGSLGVKNDEDSFYWYMKAALKGHIDAMWHAGMRLVEGVGVERSIEAGLHLIHLAADRCCYKALHFLGDAYVMGLHGIEKDKRKGEYWYRQAENAWSIHKQ
jgi:TPR repeat protein